MRKMVFYFYKNYLLETPLIVAAKNRNTEVVAVLLQNRKARANAATSVCNSFYLRMD